MPARAEFLQRQGRLRDRRVQNAVMTIDRVERDCSTVSDFRSNSLRLANLLQADLEDGGLVGKLIGANLASTNLKNADLRNADLKGDTMASYPSD